MIVSHVVTHVVIYVKLGFLVAAGCALLSGVVVSSVPLRYPDWHSQVHHFSCLNLVAFIFSHFKPLLFLLIQNSVLDQTTLIALFLSQGILGSSHSRNIASTHQLARFSAHPCCDAFS
jgi:uncharacterized oligopeptide transporter (OPT) family protein